jgi:hypothetical protein
MSKPHPMWKGPLRLRLIHAALPWKYRRQGKVDTKVDGRFSGRTRSGNYDEKSVRYDARKSYPPTVVFADHLSISLKRCADFFQRGSDNPPLSR